MDENIKAVAVFDKLAQKYQDKFMNVGLYHSSLDVLCDSIATHGGRILELACGPGNVTQYLLDKRPDLKILGADLSPNMVALAAANNPNAEFTVMDCRNIGELNETYDGVVCSFMLPYLSKEAAVKLIADVSGVLNDGGVCYLSTMEDDYSRSGIEHSSGGDEMYMHYHEAGYLSQALKDNGMTIIDLRRQDFPTGTERKMTDLIIISKKQGS